MTKKLFTFFFALVASVGTMSAAITVRLNPSSCSSWLTVRLWAWTDNGNIFDAWPGQIVNQDGDGWYSYTFDASITSVNIIWNNGSDQTIDITNVSESTCYALKSTSGWSIDVSVVDCSSVSPVDDVGYSHIQIGDLYYNLDATNQTAEVTSQNSSYPFWSTTITTAIIPSSVTYNSVSYSVTSIGNHAFSNCTGLTSVTIPNSVTSIGNYAFSGCSALTSINVASDNSNYCSVDGVLFNKDKTTLIQYPGGKQGAYTIPNSVTSIGSGAFSGCSGLTSITIPNSVTSIGDWAFDDCTGLTSVTIPNSVTSIGNYAFYGCTGLTSVTIPNSVTSIGHEAFDGCRISTIYFLGSIEEWCNKPWSPSLVSTSYKLYINNELQKDITIPNSVTSIGDYAFYGCSGLTSVTIPNSVTTMGYSAFGACSGLTSVTLNSDAIVGTPYDSNSSIKKFFGNQVTTYIIGNSVTSIGDYAFSNCTGLTAIEIPNSVTSIGNSAFSNCTGLTGELVIPNSVTSIGWGTFLWCSGLTYPIYNSHVFAFMPGSYSGAYTIPDGIESIAGAAFWGCSGLTSVTIPNSVTSIGDLAFYECIGLTSVTIPNSVTSIGSSAFSSCTGLTSVTIGNSVTSIGSSAFSYCSGLTDIYTCGDLERIKQLLGNDNRVKNKPLSYAVTTIAKEGTVSSLQLDCESVELTVTSNYGYHFSQWLDGITDNPRTITLTQDTTLTAEFAKNTYTIQVSCDETKGQVNGAGSYEYLNAVKLNATSIYGYHFAQWSDGNTNNPRTIRLTQDTSFVALFEINQYSISIQCDPIYGNIEGESGTFDYYTSHSYTVAPNYGYHFTQWSDGITDNPRTIVLTRDTTLTAEFAKNNYTITDNSDTIRGYIEGVGVHEYLEEVALTAIPNYGYHFTQWSDGVTKNPRTIVLTQDSTFSAEFAKNIYTVQLSCDQTIGQVSGMGSYEYLDAVELNATSIYGYHFDHWSDGNTDNPRTIILTQDTTFFAEFAIDKSGTCGENNALTWTYDDQSKTLTIIGNGALTENYTFGLEAPTQMNTLVIGDEVTAIGERAFYEKTTLQNVVIGSNVTSIGKYAFADINNRQFKSLVMPVELLSIGDYAFSGNTYIESIDFNAKLQTIGAYAFNDCYRVSQMTCLAVATPDLGADALTSINSYASLCVPAECLRKYKVDPNWGRFDLCELGSSETTTDTNSVTVDPSDNTALFTWPTDSAAASYSLQITKDGEVFCTLIFNSNGQLTGIAFAPSRNGAAHAQAATMSVSAMSFTVTGLSSASKYAYRLSVTDESQNELQAYSGEFATNGYEGEVNEGGEPEINTEGIEDVLFTEKATKILRNGQIFILRGDHTYTLTGQEVK